jgi:hypothetical protein
VLNILSRGKPSELHRLNNALTPKGKVNAQKALIQKALTDSKFFDLDAEPNPNAFATALNRPNFQKAKNIFFEGTQGKDRLDGLNRVLNVTRRAQDATSTVRTGEKAVFSSVALASFFEPSVIGAAAAVSAITRAFESRAFRNALVKLKGVKPGTKQEAKLFDTITTSLVAAQQAQTESEGNQNGN